ncbi:MAG TPA: SRPBCC family protein [Gemmataceae bacterium]|nr:SRPBCC family protein [Gemmataceae bacterium]
MSTIATRGGNRIRWEHFETDWPRKDTNVGNVERWLSLVGGGILALWGLQRGTLGGMAAAVAGGSLAYRGLSGHCPLYSSLGMSSARRGPATTIPAGQGVKAEETTMIQRRPEELYRYWRNLENLPRFMHHVESVQVQGDRSHWVVKGPFGTRVEWDAEIYNENPNEMIAWRSLPGATVDSAGSVHFTPAAGNRGTDVRVVLKYNPPAGRLGIRLAGLLGQDPERQIREDLQRFKQLMETGEAATT